MHGKLVAIRLTKVKVEMSPNHDPHPRYRSLSAVMDVTSRTIPSAFSLQLFLSTPAGSCEILTGAVLLRDRNSVHVHHYRSSHNVLSSGRYRGIAGEPFQPPSSTAPFGPPCPRQGHVPSGGSVDHLINARLESDLEFRCTAL